MSSCETRVQAECLVGLAMCRGEYSRNEAIARSLVITQISPKAAHWRLFMLFVSQRFCILLCKWWKASQEIHCKNVSKETSCDNCVHCCYQDSITSIHRIHWIRPSDLEWCPNKFIQDGAFLQSRDERRCPYNVESQFAVAKFALFFVALPHLIELRKCQSCRFPP